MLIMAAGHAPCRLFSKTFIRTPSHCQHRTATSPLLLATHPHLWAASCLAWARQEVACQAALLLLLLVDRRQAVSLWELH